MKNPKDPNAFTVTSLGELYEIIEDAGNKIHDIQICTDDMVEVDVSKVDEEVIPSRKPTSSSQVLQSLGQD